MVLEGVVLLVWWQNVELICKKKKKKKKCDKGEGREGEEDQVRFGMWIRKYYNISWTCLFCLSHMVMSGTEREVDW